MHIWSGEMMGVELAGRSLTAWSGVDGAKLRDPERLSQTDWEALCASRDAIGETAPRVRVDDRGGLTMAQIRASVEQTQALEGGLDLVLLDYLQLMGLPRGKDEYAAYTEASKECKRMAKDFGCVVVMLSQLSRDLEKRADKRPIMADLRATGQIEQDADIIMFPFRPKVYERDNPMVDEHSAEIDIAKQRGGETGRVQVDWEGRVTRFWNQGEVKL